MKYSEEDEDIEFSEGEEESWVECNSDEYNEDYYNDDNVFECSDKDMFFSDDNNIELSSDQVTTKKLLPAKRKHSNDMSLPEDCTYECPTGSKSKATVAHSQSCSVDPSKCKAEVPCSVSKEIINCLRNEVSNHVLQNAALQQEVLNLKKMVACLRNEKNQLRSNIACCTSAVGSPNSHNAESSSSSKASMRTCISSTQSLVNVLHSYATPSNVSSVNPLSLKNVGGMLADILWDEDLINGSLTGALLAKAKGYLLRNEFSPANILPVMDLRGGVLNYEGPEILRRCKTNGKKFCRNTVIPSTASLQRTAKIVQAYGKRHFPFRLGKVPGIGENIRFRPMDVIKAAVHSAGLEESAKKRRIQLAESLDGATLSKNLNFIMFGLKNNDLFTKDPESGDLVLAKNIQSSSNVWPIDIVMGRENSSLVQNHLNNLFIEFEKAATVRVVDDFDWKPIKSATNADMSAVWKANKAGGAMKRDENPWHCCNIRTNTIAVPNADKDQCRWCTLLGYQGVSSQKCYHNPMLTDDLVKSMEEDLIQLEGIFQGMLDELVEMRDHSEINCDENPRV